MIVLGSLPERWESERSVTSAWVGMRPMSPLEASYLLCVAQLEESEVSAGLVEIDESQVLLASSHYILISREPRDESSTCDNRGTNRFKTIWGSWAEYSLLYRLDRSDLERELGRQVTSEDLSPQQIADWNVSFVQHHVARYVVREIALIAFFLWALAAFFQKVRSPALILPTLWVASFGFMITVPLYSPAFFDADFFHHRVVVEDIWFLAYAYLLFMFVPALVSLVAYIALRLASIAAYLIGGNSTAYRGAVLVTLLLIGLGVLAGEYADYRSQSQDCRSDVRAIAARIDDLSWTTDRVFEEYDPAQALLSGFSLPSRSREKATSILAPHDSSIRCDVMMATSLNGRRLGESDFLFLIRRPRTASVYADVRQFWPTADVSSEAWDSVASGETYESSFISFLVGRYAHGKYVSIDGHEAVVFASESDWLDDEQRWRSRGILRESLEPWSRVFDQQ